MRAVFAVVMLAGGVAHAEEPAPTRPAEPGKPDDSAKSRMQRSVDGYDDNHAPVIKYVREAPIERASGFFVGANLAYAPTGRVDIRTDNMAASVAFPSVFATELQAGYRVRPFLSVALASQMLFNLRPDGEDAAKQVGVYVQATGHLILKARWDLNAFVAPGYSVLLVPDADSAKGLAFRLGAGPSFHLSKQLSVGTELSYQLGFQGRDDADLKTSFFSLIGGVRLRL